MIHFDLIGVKTKFTPQFLSLNGGNPRWKEQILLRGTGNQAHTGKGVGAGSPWGRLLAGETCEKDTTTLTGTGNKLYEGENEQHNCTLFALFTGEVDILVTVSTPLAFAPWRGRGPRGLSMRH